MEFAPEGLLVLGHVLFATLWLGAGFYQVTVIGPTMKAAGPQGAGFAMALAQRGGIGKYFAAAGALTLLFGFATFAEQKVYDVGFEGRGMWLSLGAGVAVLAFLHGAAINMPVERRWLNLANSIKGAPTPEQGKALQELGMKLGKNGAVSVLMLLVALVLMLMPRVFY